MPLRIEIGPRDLAAGKKFGRNSRRDQPVKAKDSGHPERSLRRAPDLHSIQDSLYARAKNFATRTPRDRFEKRLLRFLYAQKPREPEIHGGFALAHWTVIREIEEQIKNDLKVTIRGIPFDPEVRDDQPGKCVISGKPSPRRVLFAKSY